MARRGLFRPPPSEMSKRPEKSSAKNASADATHATPLAEIVLEELEQVRVSPAFQIGRQTREALANNFRIRDIALRLKSDAVDPLLSEGGALPPDMFILGRNRCFECPTESGAVHIIEEVKPTMMKDACFLRHQLGDTLVCVPVRIQGRHSGVLVLGRPKDPPLAAADRATLAQVGALLSSTIELQLLRELNKLIEITDPLTRVHNYRFFMQSLHTEMDRSRRYDHPFTILMIDVDNFRQINEQHGREVGDLVLRELAAILRRGIRASDTLARFSGEKFIFIFPETGRKGARTIANKIRGGVESAAFRHPESDAPIRITISGGFSVYPDDAVLAGNLVNASETALYRAKQGGRNCVKSIQDA